MLLRRLSTVPRYGFEAPFDEIERMRRQMDRLAGQFSGGYSGEQFAGVYGIFDFQFAIFDF